MAVHRVFFLLLIVAACPGAEEMQASGSTSTDGASEVPTTDGEASTEAGTMEADTTAAGTTAAPPSCPDGQVDEGEACDDGNMIDGDGCNRDCTPSATLLWEWRSGTRGGDAVRGLAVDGEGVLAVGHAGGLTRWAGRFAADGAPVWSRSYEPGAVGVALGVVVGSAVFVAGSIRSEDHDQWYARLDADGVIVWERTVDSGLGDDWATRVAAVDDDVIVAGFAAGDAGAELWARRVSADGDDVWTETFALGQAYDIWPLGPALAVTSEVAVIGWTRPPSYAELLVGRALADGSQAWANELPGTYGAVSALVAGPAGELLLAGADETEPPGALVVRRVAGDGSLLWSSPACTGENGRAVAIDGQGDVVVIGDGEAPGGSNIRLCKFSADGALRWGKDIDGGAGTDLGFAVAVDAAGRVIAGGQVQVDGDERDAWLAVFSP